MSKSNCHCKKHEECEECPEWIFTLADLVICMMGLFVILWVIKPGPTSTDAADNREWIKVAAAIREAFGYMPDPTSTDPVDAQVILNRLTSNKTRGPGHGTNLMPQRGPDGTEPEVTTIRLGPQAAIGGRLLFDPGSDTLTPPTRRALDQIVQHIRGHRNVVLVKGHTSLDDLPDATDQDRMLLSLRRAQAAADYLVSRGVEPDILRVQGCSTFEPVVQRIYTPDAQLLNRRVEVEVTTTLVTELQDRGHNR
jgi:outer membrane protein OmpA-like peptidoglycan-associated protein